MKGREEERKRWEGRRDRWEGKGNEEWRIGRRIEEEDEEMGKEGRGEDGRMEEEKEGR